MRSSVLENEAGCKCCQCHVCEEDVLEIREVVAAWRKTSKLSQFLVRARFVMPTASQVDS